MVANADPSIVVVSTYPPTRCGLASFSVSLIGGLTTHRQSNEGLHVARVLRQGDESSADPAVMTSFYPPSPAAVTAAAARISEYDAALLQHEFGIYGPDDGAAVVDLVQQISAPVVTTFHTVWEKPRPALKAITQDIAAASARVVVTVAAAAERLVETYDVPADKIVHIPHGSSWRGDVEPITSEGRPILLTWGLLTPHKGIHHAIAALPDLRDHDPRPLYWIQGATHPAVLRREGEAYRASLKRLALRLGVADMVHFDDRYLDASELERLVASAAVVILPYERADKVSSGVLTEAVATGRPVVATAFTQARELKAAGGAILLVDPGDPDRIAKAVFAVLTDPTQYTVADRQGALAPTWDVVASAYHDVTTEVVASSGSAGRSPRRGGGVANENPGDPGTVPLASNDQPQ